MTTVKFRACSQRHVAYNDTAKRCPDCGNEVISHCTKGHDFQRDSDARVLPNFCEECGEQLPWNLDAPRGPDIPGGRRRGAHR